jgi:cytochrome c oxidase assembly protein Cox11
MTLKLRGNRRQAGLTLLGLLMWAIIVGFAALIVMKVLPTIVEYSTITKAVNKIAAEGLTTVPEIRAAFDRQKEIDYNVTALSGKDLEVTKENDKVVIRFAYNKEVEIVSPVFILIKYQGSSRSR